MNETNQTLPVTAPASGAAPVQSPAPAPEAVAPQASVTPAPQATTGQDPVTAPAVDGVPANSAPETTAPSAEAHAEKLSALDKLKKFVGVKAPKAQVEAPSNMAVVSAQLQAVTQERDMLASQNAELTAGLTEITANMNERIEAGTTTAAQAPLASFGQPSESLPPANTADAPAPLMSSEEIFNKAGEESDPDKKSKLLAQATKAELAGR